MDRKINFRKILFEQTSGWERLPDNEQSSPNELKYERLGCELKKFGTKWFKKCSTPPPSTGLNKYVGEYEGEGFLPSFSVKVTDGKLYASLMGGETELTNVSDNKFKGKVSGIDFEITFELSGDSIIGGQVNGTVSGVSTTAKFKRKSSSTTSTTTTSTTSPTPWDCIENFNKKYNQFPLLRSGDYRYEDMDLEHNGKDTIFIYYKDGKAVWAYSSDEKPIMEGVWQCKKNGYLIKWADGRFSRYGTKEDFEGTTEPTKTTTDTLENPCVNGYKNGCVSEEDILNRKKALKVCSKCDLVKKVQENPEIKARIFRIQKELGKEQKTDNVFGPIMLKAIKEFQSSNGITPTGNVGEKTLTMINSYSAPKVNNNEPVINKTGVNNEPVINKTEVKPTNKAEVKPIYRRSSRQVLSPDEEL
jgi:peptidoglycan hydrolase-like protein with peptidoglycan-binding domain